MVGIVLKSSLMDQRVLLEGELNVLRDQLLLMGGEVELAIQRAIHALTERDSGVAQQVIDRDTTIDRLELDIDQLAVDVLTLRRPIGRQLRLVISIAKITPILERIADHASSIAKVAIELNDEPELKELFDLPEMANGVLEMLKSALDAFTSNDSGGARDVIAKDAEIDAIHERTVAKLLGEMSMDASKSVRLARLLFVAKNLERIGDYTKDICELTVYMKEAVFIKHQEK